MKWIMWITMILVMNINLILVGGIYVGVSSFNSELMEIDPIVQSTLAIMTGQASLERQHMTISDQNIKLWKQAERCRAFRVRVRDNSPIDILAPKYPLLSE